MKDAHTALTELLTQLDVSDQYAKHARGPIDDDKFPSVWEIQNRHLRERAREALAGLSAGLTQAPDPGRKHLRF